MKMLSTDVCGWVKQEHIVRHCTNCHCEWLEKPLNLKVTETTCPTCGGRCSPKEELFPQPDLTKLREVYEAMSNLNIHFTVNRFSGMDDMLEFAEHFRKLWQALKEVLECKD